MTILLADPRVASVPVHETYQPLVTLGRSFGPARARVRSSVAARLRRAQVALPVGISLRVVEGHRSAATQASIIARYSAWVGVAYPDLPLDELARLVSRFVAPIGVAPHVAGAAVDVTLVDLRGVELDLGTPIDATPEESGGRCYFDAPDISAAVRDRRRLLARTLTDAGLVNYPTEWWHWSYGDRYWALLTGAPAALYGPVNDLDGPLDDSARRLDEVAARRLRDAA
ncbi:MAG TPA: M15 family metallopeptidase [Jiangellales bacterium]|nr:M15 family metallopeptidase [Jiangellales bacterium]